MPGREFDVVVLGATSVTARQVCRYLARRSPAVRWAAAGRSRERIASALAELGIAVPATVLADTSDPASLLALGRRARVVLNLVGPYGPAAESVIAACIETGAHYVDLSGETPFMRRVQDRVDESARAAKVKVVQACGFEALPSDIAVRLAGAAAHERHGSPLASVEIELVLTRVPRVPRVSDILSGGTIQSLVAVLGDPDAGALTDPALLITDPARARQVRTISPLTLRARRGITGAAVGPLLPAASINPPVLQRTAELAGEPVYRYREGLRLPGGSALAVPGLVLGAGIAAGMGGLLRFGRLRAERRARITARLARRLPGAGFGPAADRLEQFSWGLELRAHTAAGHLVDVSVEGDGHPGYRTTATMMGEAGALLADPESTPRLGGYLTPAIALGTACAPRFAQAGLRFRVAAP